MTEEKKNGSAEEEPERETGAETLEGAEAAAASEAPAGDAASLREDLLAARQALRQREAELELSQKLGQETLAKLKDQHERLLRAMADLDNYKKRAAREKDETVKFGQERLLRELLPVVDNLDRALDSVAAPDAGAVRKGVEMTRKLCEDTLAKFGVKAFSATGERFDPTLHEAMQAVESDAAPDTVVREIVRGFMLHDRLLRPAAVIVARPRTPALDAAVAPSGPSAGAAPEAAHVGAEDEDAVAGGKDPGAPAS